MRRSLIAIVVALVEQPGVLAKPPPLCSGGNFICDARPANARATDRIEYRTCDDFSFLPAVAVLAFYPPTLHLYGYTLMCVMYVLPTSTSVVEPDVTCERD